MITFNQLGNLGRLGNCLFQIAATIGAATRLNDSYIFPRWKYEPFFNLHNCFQDNIRSTKTYSEPFFHYQEINPQYNKNEILNLIGYFQSPIFYQHCEQLIRDKFTFTHQTLSQNKVSIHVRRSDYVNLVDCHPMPSMDYYRQAMEILPSEKYTVFSDDIPWCRQNFLGDQFEFSEGKSEVEDLELMSKCLNGHILANSSFSWWGAWLNQNSDKKVIAPIKWFGPKLQHNTKDLCPPEWIRI